jgi:H+-translocating NAD(P) transhydrogenase subunit alpha
MPQIAVLNQQVDGEDRVALAPAGAKKLKALNVEVLVETGAGERAGFRDADYAAGATVTSDGSAVESADVILVVRRPSLDRIQRLKAGSLLVGLLSPLGDRALVDALCGQGVSGLAMELVPRITRAQAMDALSSQASIAGYKAVLLAAATAPRMFPMMMTAAGTIQPAKVFVIGAGVAGLQAIATAKRLGAVVSAYDVRPAVKEQVQSVGARFIELPLDTADAQDKGGYAKAQSDETLAKQRALMARSIADSDVVITTALVPGKPAPKLVPADAVSQMRPGSVVVDLAAERGGNCELTRPGETVHHNGVTIVGTENLAATVPLHASQVYSNNVVNLLGVLIDKQGTLKLDVADEIVKAVLVCHEGKVVSEMVAKSIG